MSSIEHISLIRDAKGSLKDIWMTAALATLVVYAILGVAGCTYIGELLIYGPLAFGYTLYIMCVTDTHRSDFNLLFKGFERFGQTLVAGLLVSLAVSVGISFLIVPGLILACGFSMTFFIMADNPEISGIDAMQQSWNMMRGYKWDFFLFNLRFIGWLLLSLITCGILMLWVAPYMTAAQLRYYRRLRYGIG